MNNITSHSYATAGGIKVRRERRTLEYQNAIEPIRTALDKQRGVLLTSSFDYPGRYTRWDMGFIDPPVALSARGRDFCLQALNSRGEILLKPAAAVLQNHEALNSLTVSDQALEGRIREADEWFPEELRSKQPTAFSVVRALIELFASAEDQYLGLYGAFGYELAFQFDKIRTRLTREDDQRDLVLYLPDDLLVVDHRLRSALRYSYDFETDAGCTEGKARDGRTEDFQAGAQAAAACDHKPGEYAATVRKALKAFERGDLFEVVPSQTFARPCSVSPAELFRRLLKRNPAPYGAFINLGRQEYLVAASPEMFVRVEGRRIETCPISGTIARGKDAIEDADQIRALLNSKKDESELTMCTDVDRNDKSRVCKAGSVRVIGRRQIEMYSRLIHTVDHVEGILRDEFDALDGFLAHAWAVTVTGAPKQHAIQFIEDHEHSPRRWYGGALGFIGFNGSMNTGLTLRTIRVAKGVAEVRAGATLLYESDPDSEEQETRLKASAFLDAIERPDEQQPASAERSDQPGKGRKIIMVDHEDSFVHTLAAYFRATGAEVATYRTGFPLKRLAEEAPDLVLLSPGPGRPEDFKLKDTIAAALEAGLPLFGVCLGLQGLIEYFGGELGVLEVPTHGKPSEIEVCGGKIFKNFPERFTAGRYHSLYAKPESLPEELIVTAKSSDGVIMGIEHSSLPIAAVQFHPESIMTLKEDLGQKLVDNIVTSLQG